MPKYTPYFTEYCDRCAMPESQCTCPEQAGEEEEVDWFIKWGFRVMVVELIYIVAMILNW